MFKKFLLVLVVIVVGLMIYAGLKNPQMKIERAITIKASPEKLFPYINSSKKTNEWMPCQDADPMSTTNYTGPDEGVGSKSSWTSTGKMGTGEATIVESVPPQFVKTQLTYTKPMNMSQTATVSLTPAGEGETLVRWSVDGHNSFMFRLFGIFVNVDKAVGGEFEKGLAKLKATAEAAK